MNNQSTNKTKILIISIKMDLSDSEMDSVMQCIKKLKEVNNSNNNLQIFVIPSGVISSTLCVDIPETLFSINDVISGKMEATDDINKLIGMIENKLNTENEQSIPNKEELIISSAKLYLDRYSNNNVDEEPEYICIIRDLLKIIEGYKNEK